jgi:osmotically-inducible protein OsmY
MTTASITPTDIRLRDNVVRQLDWSPEVDASSVGVAAKDGVVTLTGFVDSFTGKLAAERVVKQVRGVRAVANDIVVRLVVDRTDADIAHDATQALQLRPGIADNVQTVVHSGHVTLTGTVEWLFQKEQAEHAVRHVRGVRGVINHINVNAKAGIRDVHRRIVRALHRNADVDSRCIDVSVSNNVVTLKGTVRSWMQRQAAEEAAASAPGIRRVDNEIIVEPVEAHEEPNFETADEIC